ncbi:MAG: glycosyltransferase family 39 protein [Anaerolineaceae bacterium]
MDGTFDITKAYGPDEQHALYGPAYILAGRGIVYFLEGITGLDWGTLWHLVNFICFQVGLIFLYLLCRRWVSSWSAFFATLLFGTQPLLWGHAFINPKDIPFMAFFLAAFYAGLKFVDRIRTPEPPVQTVEAGDEMRWHRLRRRWIHWGIVFSALIVVLMFFNPLIRSAIQSLMEGIYNADAGSFWGKAFRAVAEDASKVGVDYYAGKLLSIYRWARIGLLAILISLWTVAVTIWAFPASIIRFWRRFTFKDRETSFWNAVKRAAIPGILLGLVTSVRVLGPMVGVLVVLYFLLSKGRRPVREMLIYFVLAGITVYLTWPYLWANPVGNFMNVLLHMSNNPQPVILIFNGETIASPDLPWTYLPTLLGITLTEPVWFLFLGGLALAIVWMVRKRLEWRDLLVTILWFFILFFYVVLTRPPMYDGFRHFLFILPPAFVVISIFFEGIIQWVKNPVIRWTILSVLVIPGVMGIAALHPYEYAYYNQFVGGSAGAYRLYENDYWLTCYREAMQPFKETTDQKPTVYVDRQPTLAASYVGDAVQVLPYKKSETNLKPGDYILLSTRNNRDQTFQQDSEIRWTVGRQGSTYCIVKQAR